MKPPGAIRTFYLIFLILVSLFIVYIMAGLMLFRGEVFIERDHLAIPELAIGIGFVLVIISVPISMIRIFSGKAASALTPISRTVLIVLGGFALIALPVEKVMLDEIAKELPAGMNSMGEWIILYACLFIQFIFQMGITLQMVKLRQKKG
ncbi:MAG: hypothetical protein ACWGNV_00435 [Bacteroidales bacterium]